MHVVCGFIYTYDITLNNINHKQLFNKLVNSVISVKSYFESSNIGYMYLAGTINLRKGEMWAPILSLFHYEDTPSFYLLYKIYILAIN